MDTPTSSMRDLARRLMTASQTGTGAHVSKPAAVIERLRISLAKFAGDAGFESLLRRAMVLARPELPSLHNVKIDSVGRLDGLDQPGTGTSALGEEAAVAITAHLLGLLVVFIGESLTLRLLREAWPDTRITLKSREADQ